MDSNFRYRGAKAVDFRSIPGIGPLFLPWRRRHGRAQLKSAKPLLDVLAELAALRMRGSLPTKSTSRSDAFGVDGVGGTREPG
jgi:hypothetical protein